MNARYSRQEVLPEFDSQTQQKIKESSVLVVGAGALGCVCLTYLVRAGVGKIGIVDKDLVDLSNLHRQSLYTEKDLNKPKVECAINYLQTVNSDIQFEAHITFLTKENAISIIENYDIVVDGTDNFPTRYLINDACYFLEKPNVHGSISGFEGQLAVFNVNEANDFSANYRDLYPEPPAFDSVKNCAEAGVIGALPGIIGSMQALETIKLITGIGEILKNQLFRINTLNYQTQLLKFTKLSNNPLSGENKQIHTFVDYNEFCGYKNNNMKMKTVKELQELIDKGTKFQLIDVREPSEFNEGNLKGILMPLNEVPERISEIRKDVPVVVHCRSGVRSANAIDWLEANFAFDNLYNLEGGILAWNNLYGKPLA